MDEVDRNVILGIEGLLDATRLGRRTKKESALPGPRRFVEVPEALVVPFGSSLAYSLNIEGQVSGIKISHLGSNPNSIAKWLCELKRLRRLVINSPEKLEFPDELAELPELSFIWLNGTIARLPERLFREDLPIVVESDKSMGALSREAIQFLTEMRDREIVVKTGDRKSRQKALSDTPESEAVLSASYKPLESELMAMRGIHLADGIALSDPPLEIASKGAAAIRKYLEERGASALPLKELKIILVGHGGSGKTSLVKCILGEKFDSKERQTHGINIKKASLKVRDDDIKLHYWDFGGQEIMHATHQFFLSKRSAYILVLDGRKDEDAEYWLQHIESFGADSPIFLVLNKIDEHPAFDVNRRFLTAKYNGIAGFFRISCAKNDGIEDLKKALAHVLPEVPMLQTRWPLHWFHVKRELEAKQTPYVTLKEYRDICTRSQVSGAENQELLVDFLHDLGVVLHFKELQLLDTHVLDPRWVTEGVYKIINSKALAAGHGILKLDELNEILHRRGGQTFTYPREKHAFLVDLMLKFELCYRVGTDLILIPDLLDIQEPILEEPPDTSVRFIFEYAYLPRSILPRTIVRLHGDIKQAKRWRSGVLLADPLLHATAIVRADYKARRIYIEVWGKQSRDYLATLRKVIADINSTFERLAVTEYTPLPDHPEILVEYQELVGHETSGRLELFVGKLGKAYDVRKLLNGVDAPNAKRMTEGIQIHGNLFTGAATVMNVAQSTTLSSEEARMAYIPKAWERALAYLTALSFLGLVGYLLVRNQQIIDPNLVVALRLILSLTVAIFGATIPGLLHVDLSTRGILIRASGALALFVLAYLFTPQVLPPLVAR